MSGDEARKKLEIRMTKKREASRRGFRSADFVILSAFVICRGLPHLAAIARAEFHWQSAVAPFCYAAAVHAERLFGDARVAEHGGRKLAVFTFAPSAVHNDLLCQAAQGQDGRQILIRIV